MSLGLRRHPLSDPRRREVEAALADAGLLRRPRPLEWDADDLGERLRQAFGELGPVFRELGLYLAARVDLLPLRDALALAALPRWREPLPPDSVRARLAAELGRPLEEVFAELAEAPFASRLLAQAHRARLRDGRPVVVRLARDLDAGLAADLELLPLAAEPLTATGVGSAAAASVVTDFRRELASGDDLERTASALELLAADARSFGLLVAPAAHRDLSGPRLLITDDPDGTPPDAAAVPATDAARRLAMVWLHQALLGRVVPLEVSGESASLLPEGRVSFAAGPFAEPSAAAQRDLWHLLVATAAHEPDTAATYLLRQVRVEPEATTEERLRLHLRQVVPLRDGAWSVPGDGLAEQLFAYVRAARIDGFVARRPLRDLCRGLFSLAAETRRLEPERDVVREALQEVRVLASLTQMREALDPRQWGGQLESSALLLADLPQRLDELLSRAAEEGTRAEPEPVERRRDGMGRVATLTLALAAMALLGQSIAAAGWLGGLGEEITAALFLGLGGLLLWTVGRSG